MAAKRSHVRGGVATIEEDFVDEEDFAEAEGEEEEEEEEEEEAATKSKRERFKELVIPRLARSLASLRVMANCGNRASYEYSEREANQIITQLRAAVDRVETAFNEKEVKNTASIEFDE